MAKKQGRRSIVTFLHTIYPTQAPCFTPWSRCFVCYIFKLISIADCAPSFELVRRRKFSKRAIFTATVTIKIADWLFLRRLLP